MVKGWTYMDRPHDRERKIVREAGRRFAALREIVAIRCLVCGRETSGTKRRRYCSDACRVRASRERSQVQARTMPDSTRHNLEDYVSRLDRVRHAIMRGRHFEDDSTELLRTAREGRPTL